MEDQLHPDDEPVYVAETAPAHSYAYGPVNHYGYGYPRPSHPYAPPAVARRSEPRVGWLLVAAGALALVGAFLPWFHVVAPLSPDPYGTVSIPDERGGLPVILLGLLIMTAGAWIGVRRGDFWSPLAALVAGGLGILLALLAIAGEKVFNAFSFENEVTARFGVGLWLDLGASVVALALSIVALTRRGPVQAPR